MKICHETFDCGVRLVNAKLIAFFSLIVFVKIEQPRTELDRLISFTLIIF